MEECKKLKRAGRTEELKNGTDFNPKFIQHLIFQSDYAIPKPKKEVKRKNTGAEGTAHESASKTNVTDGAHYGQSLLQMNVHNPNVSEAADSASMASFNHMAGGFNAFDGPGDT